MQSAAGADCALPSGWSPIMTTRPAFRRNRRNGAFYSHFCAHLSVWALLAAIAAAEAVALAWMWRRDVRQQRELEVLRRRALQARVAGDLRLAVHVAKLARRRRRGNSGGGVSVQSPACM